MNVLRFGVVMALTAGLSGASAMAQDGGGEVASVRFQLRTSARVVERVAGADATRLAAFSGGGHAAATRRAIALSAGQLSQIDGDGTLDLAPSGPLKRLRRSRVYVGRGSGTATVGDREIGFERVRIAAHIRGRGDRVRLLGKFHGVGDEDVNTAGADSDLVATRTVLNGRFRGRIAPPEPAQ